MTTNEQFAAAQKAQIATLLGLASTGLDAAEKLVALNLETARGALAEADAQAQALLGAKDMQSLFALQAEWLQPAPEKAGAYGRKLYDIVSRVQAELSEVAEAGAADAQRKFAALVESAAKNAPAGSEQAVAMAKAAFAAANDAFGNAQKAAKQAAEAAEANIVKFSAATKPAAKSRRAA
ncbi:phasin family protein [Piscinibacter sp.]|uniref:phasin family protein n=1 Tax=Piscinibacter sp. TaxID=1903157 RepID=UPI0039E6D643